MMANLFYNVEVHPTVITAQGKAILLRYVDSAHRQFHDHWARGEGVPDIGTMKNELLVACRNKYYADSAQRIFSQVSMTTPLSIRPIFLLIKFFPFVVHFPLFLSYL